MPTTPHRRFALAISVIVLAARLIAHPPATEMLDAANKFVGSLSPEQKAKATYALTDKERENWNFVPIARQGLPLKEMNDTQHDLALALLRSGLSHAGMARAEAIMSMELVLKELEKNGRITRDPTLYFVTIFGTPSATQSWGWRWEGHHQSFNFTVVDGAHVFFTPSFIGSNPAEVLSGPRKGERPLGEEDDRGRALVKSLDEAERQVAVIAAKAPTDIITSNKHRIDPLSPEGLTAAKMTPGQREQLVALVKLYIGRARAELADETWQKIAAAGTDRIAFAWAGGFERGEGNYYRIQGPTFVIEFDNTQNKANHIHSVFRDFKDDFGHDLLAEHYAKDHAQ